MSAPDGRNWWRLVGVAILVASLMVPVAFTALIGLHAATWTETWSLLDPRGNEPLWLLVLAVAVGSVLMLIPGAVVGRVAELSRGWRRAAAVMAAFGGLVTAACTNAAIFGAVPGLVGGSLLAVVLADRLGRGVADVPAGADRPGPTRSREDR
jgi:hypothetical protein